MEDYLGIKRGGSKAVVAYDPQNDVDTSAYDMPFEPFKDLCKRRFMWYYDSYLATIDRELKTYPEGRPFEKMPFEGPGNTMDGTFRYKELRDRLANIRKKLDEETDSWAAEGKDALAKELTIANNISRQFEQVGELFKKSDLPLQLELVDKNPFVWSLMIFGRPMTNLDGGIFRVKIYISPRFPEEQPRIKFETPLFHQRISTAGVLCYFPQKQDELKYHVEAIIAAIEDESPAYDPRTLVNLEAAKLFWGSQDDKKTYNRKLRRSVQDSSEYVDTILRVLSQANIPLRNRYC